MLAQPDADAMWALDEEIVRDDKAPIDSWLDEQLRTDSSINSSAAQTLGTLVDFSDELSTYRSISDVPDDAPALRGLRQAEAGEGGKEPMLYTLPIDEGSATRSLESRADQGDRKRPRTDASVGHQDVSEALERQARKGAPLVGADMDEAKRLCERLSTEQMRRWFSPPNNPAVRMQLLHIACQRGHVDLARMLLEKGAPIEEGCAHPKGALRPLHIAIRTRDHKLAKLLLEFRANVEAPLPGEGTCPLQMACSRVDHEMVRILLLGGATTEALPSPRNTQDPYSVVNEYDCGVNLEYERAIQSNVCAHLRELEVNRDSLLWLKAELDFLRSLAGTYSQRYMFDVVRVVKVENDQLTRAFETKKAELGGKELTVFHGTQRNSLVNICQSGLQPGMPSVNVNDGGYFGDRMSGVYVTAFADYAMYYCAPPGRKPDSGLRNDLTPPDRMALVMLRCVTGRRNKLGSLAAGRERPPDQGYNSNESPAGLEYFLYESSMCCPAYIVHVQRRDRVSILHDGV